MCSHLDVGNGGGVKAVLNCIGWVGVVLFQVQ